MAIYTKQQAIDRAIQLGWTLSDVEREIAIQELNVTEASSARERKFQQEHLTRLKQIRRFLQTKSNPGIQLKRLGFTPSYEVFVNDKKVGELRNLSSGRLQAKDQWSFNGEFLADNLEKAKQKLLPRLQAMLKEKNPLLKRRNSAQSREARQMAENFHGRAVERTITVDEVDKDPTDYAVIGELEELEVMPIGSRKIHTINFLDQWDKEKKIVEVCCDAEGQQIYFVKGDQDIDNLLDGLAGDTKQSFGQRHIVVGHLVAISYFTDKWHLDDKDEPLWRVYSIRGGCRELEEADLKEKPACELRDELSAEGLEVVIGTPYRHEFGEDGGEFPFLVYDELNKRLSLAGGTYEVRDVGIWN